MNDVEVALFRLGLSWADVYQLQFDLRCAIKRSNNSLLRSLR